jgi:hypothetical protein
MGSRRSRFALLARRLAAMLRAPHKTRLIRAATACPLRRAVMSRVRERSGIGANRRSLTLAAPILLGVLSGLCWTGCQSPGSGPSWWTGGSAGDEGEEIWAIRCVTFEGSNRFQQADNCADHLRHVSGLRADRVQVMHEPEVSTVYYGRYRQQYDPHSQRETFEPDPHNDLELIRSLAMRVDPRVYGQSEIWPFRLATVEALPVKSGVPDEWRLENAPGVYSLQVAVFYNTEGMRRRRYAAEEYCRVLRGEGRQAYVHHGSAKSSVCIGSFGEDAIQSVQRADPLTGRVTVRQRIVDPQMLELQKDYPHNLHNGYTAYQVVRDPRSGQEKREPHYSFPVRIPRDGPTARFGGP